MLAERGVFLFKSLLCFQGYDNGRRFLLISLACYGFFLLLSPVLNQAPVLLILLLLMTLPVILATSMRRIHDAAFATPLAGVPVLVYLVNVFAITYIEHGARFSFLLLAFLATAAFTLVSNARIRRQRDYRLGYSGPLNEKTDAELVLQRQYFRRIEPTIAGVKSDVDEESQQVTHAYIEESLSPAQETNQRTSFTTSSAGSAQNKNWEQLAGDWFLANRTPVIAAASLTLVVFISLLGWIIFSDESTDTQVQQTKQPAEISKERKNKIELPDNFFIMHDQFNAMTVAWQGAVREDGEVWSPATAVGDKDCVAMRFNNGDSFRTVAVTVKNQGDYYADFSPVDSQAIIQNIALQSRFTLCGIEFSLKGTQAVLMNNRVYSAYLIEP